METFFPPLCDGSMWAPLGTLPKPVPVKKQTKKPETKQKALFIKLACGIFISVPCYSHAEGGGDLLRKVHFVCSREMTQKSGRRKQWR